MSHRVIGLVPASAGRERRRLLAALEDAFPVRFEPRTPGSLNGLDALVMLGEHGIRDFSGPALILPREAPPAGRRRAISFSGADAVDPRLRGRTLHEAAAGVIELDAPARAEEVLATSDAGPAWIRAADGRRQRAAAAPAELGAREPLKEALRAGAFFGLLPLVQFLRELTAREAWTPAPLRALLMFDDPNLRWRSYGHIDYRRLAAHAERHDYAAAMAMVPLDAPLYSRGAAQLFAPGSRLSLLMHGIVHERRELMRPLPPAERERALARALRQIEGFERRSGVRVSRVMCAPHGEASEDFLESMLRVGLDAVFADLPFPWRPGEAPRGPALTYWHGANFVAGGLPVIPRYPFTYDPEEVVLRAYLDHPLILYGHHEDVEGGLEPLAAAAELVNGLGDVRWACAESIALGNFMSRCNSDDELGLLMLARRVEVEVPDGVRRIEVVIPLVNGREPECELVGGSGPQRIRTSASGPTTVHVEVAGPGPTRLELRPLRRVDHRRVGPARVRPWPVVRRALTEGRDRLRPLVR